MNRCLDELRKTESGVRGLKEPETFYYHSGPGFKYRMIRWGYSDQHRGNEEIQAAIAMFYELIDSNVKPCQRTKIFLACGSGPKKLSARFLSYFSSHIDIIGTFMDSVHMIVTLQKLKFKIFSVFKNR